MTSSYEVTTITAVTNVFPLALERSHFPREEIRDTGEISKG